MNAIASFYKCLPSAMNRSNRRLCLRALLQRGLLKQVKALVFICCCYVFMCSHEYNYEEGCQILYSCMLLTVIYILAYQYLFLYVCLLICLSVCLTLCSVGPLCIYEEGDNSASTHENCSTTFTDYFRTLQQDCRAGQPGVLQWTPDKNMPDTVYYQVCLHIGVLGSCQHTNKCRRFE